MIDPKDATTYIANKLDELLNDGTIKGSLNRSKTSISIYLKLKSKENPPAKFITTKLSVII